MNLLPYSFNGTLINDGTNFVSAFTGGWQFLQAPSNEVEVIRTYLPPVHGAKVLQSRNVVLTITMRGTTHTQIDTLRALFDTQDQTPHEFIAIDIDDSNRQWYIETTCIQMQNMRGTTVEFVLHVHDSVWKTVTPSTGSKAVTASGDQVTLTALGNKNAHPVISITPTTLPASTYAYQRRVDVRNATTQNLQTYPVEITGGGWDTATLVSGGKMLATGDDCRVMVDGIETTRWLADINTNHTKVWIALSLAPKIELLLNANIANSGLVDIVIKNNSANQKLLKTLPSGAILLIGSEIFIGGVPNVSLMKIPMTARAVKGTSAAAHTAGATIYWIPHDIWIVYGYLSADAPVGDDSLEPLFNLSSSTNSSWVYNTAFFDANNDRTGGWAAVLNSSNGDLSHYYTATLDTMADLATAMGASINAFQKGTKWVAEKAAISWDLVNQCGFSNVTASGKQYRTTATWPSVASFRHSSNGKDWSTDWNQTSPAGTSSWTAWSKGSTAISGSPTNVQFYFSGVQPATANAVASFEVLAVTLALVGANVPTVNFAAEQSNCQLACTITNVSTGESFSINYPAMTNKTMVVDCNLHSVVEDSQPAISALSLSTIRVEWLDLVPGANVIQYDQTGTGNVTLGFSWENRSL